MIHQIGNNGITWIDIINPGADDIDFLRKNFNFHDLDLEDCLSKVQRPKSEIYEDYKFLVVNFPIAVNKNYRLIIEELDIFIGKNYIITLHSSRLTKLAEMFTYLQNTEVKFNKYFSRGADYLLYKILNRMILQIFPLMTQIGHDIDWIDSNFDSIKPAKVLERISALRRNIIFLQTSLKPQRSIFSTFENTKDQEDKNMDIYWGGIGDYINKLLDMAEDYQELVEGLYSSIDTLLTYRTNNIMKILTMFNVVMLPLTFLSSFYGMNIKLPFAGSEHAATFITSAMFLSSVGVFIYFKFSKF